MIDLHIHSIFSDGELIPMEIISRMHYLGNEGLAITDHVDFSNLSLVLNNLRKLTDFRDDYELDVLFGVEITHVPPNLIGRAVELAWKEGAEIVIVHGETIVEPVKEGTNYMAVQEEIDILAHPGLIDLETAELAKENGVFLEISARKGHSLTNGHVAKIAIEVGCDLVINTDAHSPNDFITTDLAIKILKGAGVEDYKEVLENPRKIIKKRLK
ncbi:MAG TPA: histidinol phosphate phosphatase domain-containing protein [Archaeoglobus profundus]|nr:histidinol phosphate phosphatase domain-containing protein [Archaeoglobus profundus]